MQKGLPEITNTLDESEYSRLSVSVGLALRQKLWPITLTYHYAFSWTNLVISVYNVVNYWPDYCKVLCVGLPLKAFWNF